MINVCFDGALESVLCAARTASHEQHVDFGDILCFPDNLTIGSLVPFTAEHRLAELSRIEGASLAHRKNDWIEFSHRLSTTDDQIRVWSTGRSCEKLALCYACSLLRACHIEFFPLERNHLQAMDWDRPLAAIPSKAHTLDCRKLAHEWRRLIEAERDICSPRLRIFVGDRIQSVPENYFDNCIENYLESHALDEYTRAMLPFLLTDEIEHATGNLIVPEFLSVRLCMILGFSKNPWRPAIQIP